MFGIVHESKQPPINSRRGSHCPFPTRHRHISSAAMSHSHSHAPGESHSHSHGPQSPAPQTPQTPVMPPMDPAMQALIDQDYRPVALTLGNDNNMAFCEPHKLEKCEQCDVDYINLNRLSMILANNPTLLCPPPANVVTQRITQIVTATKDEGNVSLHTVFFFSILFLDLILDSTEPIQKRESPCSSEPLHRRRVNRVLPPSLGGQPIYARGALHRHVQPLGGVL
jgi:hypothetical protein